MSVSSRKIFEVIQQRRDSSDNLLKNYVLVVFENELHKELNLPEDIPQELNLPDSMQQLIKQARHLDK